MLAKIFQNFMTTISLVTALGVFIHDGRVDRATTTAIGSTVRVPLSSSPSLLARFVDFTATDAHTHPDHNPGRSLLSNAFTYQKPSIAPRRDSHHKQLKQLLEGGRHAFDNVYLPVII